MLQNFAGQSKKAILCSQETLAKEEREIRRALRIKQVRQQSSVICSERLQKAKRLKEKEEQANKALNEKTLRELKQTRLRQLQSELDYGLESFGQSQKAVEKELQALKAKKEQVEVNQRLAKKRGAIAFTLEYCHQEEERLQQEQQRIRREAVRCVENKRAMAVASLPPCIKPQPEAKPADVPKVEVYDISRPQHSRHVQFAPVPEGIVKKVKQDNKLKADEEALRERVTKQKKVEQEKSTKELVTWLGTAAGARKIYEKEYKLLGTKLKQLEQLEKSSRQREALSLVDLDKLERKLAKRKEKPRKTIPTKMADEGRESASPEMMDFTEFPCTQFTEEEARTLGPTTQSLQTLLNSLAEQSRQRLEEVVGSDYYYCSDDDFAEPTHSALNVSVESSLSVSVPANASVSTSSELTVSVKKHKKKKKKKSKHRSKESSEEPMSTNSTQYMNPPDRLSEDQIADYLASIAKEKEQLLHGMGAHGPEPLNVPLFINQLMAMSRNKVENLSVEDSSLEFSSKQSTSSFAVEASVDGAKSVAFDSFKEASTAYLSLHNLNAKDPLSTQVEPHPDTSDLLRLATAPAEPLVRPMENLRLSTIMETSSELSNSSTNEEATFNLEAELKKRGLPMPQLGTSLTAAAEELLAKMPVLSTSEEYRQVFHSTPANSESSMLVNNRNFERDSLHENLSPILPSGGDSKDSL